MRALFATRGPIVVAILSLALLFASVCSTTCAMGYAPGAAQPAGNHGCEHALPESSGGSHHPAPEKQRCFGHHHSTFDALKGNGLSQFQLRSEGHALGGYLSGTVASAGVFDLALSSASDLAPPSPATNPFRAKISVLRI
ncbi:MAG: hypothetical protein WA192_19410 [Candidatus Acidiferrales bacterium]